MNSKTSALCKISSSSIIKPWQFTLLLSTLNTWVLADQTEGALDWAPLGTLDDEQQQEIRASCRGAYIAPQRTDADALLPADRAAIKVTAGEATIKGLSITEGASDYIEMRDQVDITQGDRRMQADRAIVDKADEHIALRGGITLREPDLLVTGNSATINHSDDTIVIDDAEYVVHSMNTRGSAKRIAKVNDSRLVLTDSNYTQCPPEDNSWLLTSSSITIDTEKEQGFARNVRLLVKDVPVFYSPYLRFPLSDRRQSGFLSPSISSSENQGIDIAIPFYLNLAPNYDVLLTPSFLDDHGFLLEADARHLSRSFYTEVNVAYLDNDRGDFDREEQRLIDSGELTAAQASPFKDKKRWLLDVRQRGGRGQRWSSTIDYAKVSDDDYFRDLDKSSGNGSDKTHLNQHITIDYRFQHWQIGVEAKKFQSLIDEKIDIAAGGQMDENTLPENTLPYQQLPLLEANATYGWRNWLIRLDHEWIRFDHDGESTTGDRTRLNYQLSWEHTRQGGFFKPALQLKYLHYALNDESFAARPSSVVVPQAIVDAGLFFERDGRWFDHRYRQAFEPRLYYFRSQFKDQTAFIPIDFDTADLTFSYNQLFRDTRFSGGDRIDDADQLSLGLTTRFTSLQSGHEWLDLNVGKIFYFDDRRITLTGVPDTDRSSDISSRIRSALNDRWHLTSDLRYNRSNHKIGSGNVSLKYRNDNDSLFNLDYRYVRDSSKQDTVKQLDTSLIVPIHAYKWYFIGQNGYDITNSRQLQLLAGFEYNSCCYRIRFAWQQLLDSDLVNIVDNDDLTYDRGWFIQIQLRGLGGTGEQLNELFDKNIDGYSEWQARRR